jgi:hypothetical protein
MSLSEDGSLLDHLAAHVLFLSTASSFWYSIDSSYDHECHLSQRLGVSPQAYEYLLVVANLAYFHPKWGFSIKTRMWQPFIDGHRFSASHDRGTFEINSKKLGLTSFILGVSPKHRVRSNFIWIGILAVDSRRKIELQRYSDGRMKTTPPRLNGLHFRWQTFRELMDPFV